MGKCGIVLASVLLIGCEAGNAGAIGDVSPLHCTVALQMYVTLAQQAGDDALAKNLIVHQSWYAEQAKKSGVDRSDAKLEKLSEKMVEGGDATLKLAERCMKSEEQDPEFQHWLKTR